MTPLELVGLLGSSASISQVLSKFFLPKVDIRPEIKVEYHYKLGYLAYNAEFTIPEMKRFRIKKKKPNIQLNCQEGFLNIRSRINSSTSAVEITIPTIYCSLLPFINNSYTDKKILAGTKVLLDIQINIDLSHKIICEWIDPLPGNNHQKARIINTMDIHVKNFETQERIINGKKLRRASILKGGAQSQAPFNIVNESVLYSKGDLDAEYPNINTSDEKWINSPEVERSSRVIVPIESIEPQQELFIDLLYE